MRKIHKLFSLFLALALILSAPAIVRADGKAGKDSTPAGKDGIVRVPYEPSQITPDVKPYTVQKDFSNVENFKRFKGFSKEQTEALLNSGFFISPIDQESGREWLNLKDQLFFTYEDNEYQMIPNFVTTDSVLHLYHLFYDNFLGRFEEKTLLPQLRKETKALAEAACAQYEALTDKDVKTLALRNCAFLTVGLKLLDEKLPEGMPQEAIDLAAAELKSIKAETGPDSPIFKMPMDYGQFKPRGHYTKNEDLKTYFRTVMYFGQGSFSAYRLDEMGQAEPRPDLIGMGMLMTALLDSNKKLAEGLDLLTDPITFLVESADDLTYRDYAPVLHKVLGEKPDLNKLLDKEVNNRLYEAILNLPAPKIAFYLGQSFRLMPQRAVLDNVWMQQLLDVIKPSKRPIYSGLDLLAVLGDEKAAKEQLADPYNKHWDKYPENLKKVTKQVAAMTDEEWQKNLYRGWLWVLKEYAAQDSKGLPAFMQNTAWQMKSRNTALGSWAELKHDTLLYSKQLMAEMGGGMPPKPLPGYVEPNLPVYEKLRWLINFTKTNLSERKMLEVRDEASLEAFRDMLDFLISCTKKELANTPFTEDETRRLHYIGGAMEQIAVGFFENSNSWNLVNENDRSMAIIADLMKVPENAVDLPKDEILSVGVTPAQFIYVIYPVDGKLYLGRGAVFGYREFLSKERLTDEEWRKMLDEGKDPGAPAWMKEVLKPGKVEITPAPEPGF